MTTTPTEGEVARCLPISRTLLTRVRELNADYLELLAGECDSSGCSSHGAQYLSAEVVDRLARLPVEARHALASCPFALFTLGFTDSAFWCHAIGGAEGEPAMVRYRPVLNEARPHNLFADTALAFAWHVAQVNRLASRMLFGMHDAVVKVLYDAPLWRLKRVVHDYPGLVTPRWPRNPHFWPELVRLAATGDWARLFDACVLGRQLTAADFEPPNREGVGAMCVWRVNESLIRKKC